MSIIDHNSSSRDERLHERGVHNHTKGEHGDIRRLEAEVARLQERVKEAERHWKRCEEGWNTVIKEAEDFLAERNCYKVRDKLRGEALKEIRLSARQRAGGGDFDTNHQLLRQIQRRAHAALAAPLGRPEEEEKR
jgi:chromosome segregation ATPase